MKCTLLYLKMEIKSWYICFNVWGLHVCILHEYMTGPWSDPSGNIACIHPSYTVQSHQAYCIIPSLLLICFCLLFLLLTIIVNHTAVICSLDRHFSVCESQFNNTSYPVVTLCKQVMKMRQMWVLKCLVHPVSMPVS